MKTTTLQTKTIAFLKQVETEKPPPLKRTENLAQKEFEFYLAGIVILGFLWRIFGAWIGRESIRLETEPGKFVTRTEEYQDLHTQVGLNSFFRMH